MEIKDVGWNINERHRKRDRNRKALIALEEQDQLKQEQKMPDSIFKSNKQTQKSKQVSKQINKTKKDFFLSKKLQAAERK